MRRQTELAVVGIVVPFQRNGGIFKFLNRDRYIVW